MAVRFRDRKPNAAPVTAEQKKRTALDNALREQRWQDAIDTATAEPRLLAMGKRGHGSWLPLHQAAAGNAPVEVLQKLAELHPAALSTTAVPVTGHGLATKDLPLHLLAMNRDASLAAFRALVQPYPEALVAKDRDQRTPLDWAKMKQAAPECLTYLTDFLPMLEAARSKNWHALRAYQTKTPAAWVLELAAEHGGNEPKELDKLCEISGLAITMEAREWERIGRLSMITHESVKVCLRKSPLLGLAVVLRAPDSIQLAIWEAHVAVLPAYGDWLAQHGFQDKKYKLSRKIGTDDPLEFLVMMLEQDEDAFETMLENFEDEDEDDDEEFQDDFRSAVQVLSEQEIHEPRPAYDEWLAAHGWLARKEQMASVVQEEDDPLGALVRMLKDEEDMFNCVVGSAPSPTTGRYWGLFVNDKESQDKFRSAVQALMNQLQVQIDATVQIMATTHSEVVVKHILAVTTPVKLGPGVLVKWKNGGRAGAVQEKAGRDKWKIAWSDDGAGSRSIFEVVDTNQLAVTDTVCMIKNSQGQNALEYAITNDDPPDHAVQAIKVLITATGGIDVPLDSDKRTSRSILQGAKDERFRDIAATWGCYRGRWKLVDWIQHISKTCLVIFAADILHDNKLVALKFMLNEDEWLREQSMRKLDDDTPMDSSHVLPLLDVLRLDEDPGLFDSRLNGEGGESYRYLITMDRARQDLSNALAHSQLAGHDEAKVKRILYQAFVHFKYLNVLCSRIHGDVKPRNLVEIEVVTASGTDLCWLPIDMDASCKMGSVAGQKVTSSGCFPPEMARQVLAKGAGPTRAADLTALVAQKEQELRAAMESRDTDGVVLLSSEIKRFKAEIKHAGDTEPIVASVGFEMWYLGTLMYQLTTLDGLTMWSTDQADNIDEEQMRQLAYEWDSVKQAKLDKVVWPQAKHLVGWLLQENLADRPLSYDQVLGHPFFASERGPATTKHVVMSCPEMGTLNPDGASGPYDQKVMEMVAWLQKLGFVKFGFDRAGTSTSRAEDVALFDKAFALVAAGKHDDAKVLFKSTAWFYGYETSVKQAVKLEAQGFDGVLQVTCIRGGPITQVEAQEMERIMGEATRDCAKSGIVVQYKISIMSYYEFLQLHDPTAVVQQLERDRAPAPEPERAPEPEIDVRAELARALAALAQEKAVVAAQASAITEKNAQLAVLRAQLLPREAVPPS